MLRDLIFYPLALLIIAGMVATALSFGGGESLSNDEIMRDGWQMSGDDLQSLTISPGSEGEYIAEEGGYMRLSQFTPMGEGPASIGVFATLGPDHERAFMGQNLQITLRARKSRRNGLARFDTDYYPIESPAAGWKTFELGPVWQTYTYTFKPRVVDAPPNVDLIAIFPGRAGRLQAMDLSSIRVDVITP